MPPPHTLTLFGTLTEAKRIFSAHSRHFLALSVLFLLPLSFSLIIFPTLQLSLTQSYVVSTQFLTLHPTHPHLPQHFTLPLIYTLFIYTFFLCATATITYSTFHGFYGRPVKFFPAIKSLISSFFPLVCTTFAATLVLFTISLTLFLLFMVIVIVGENLGFVIVIDYNSYYFMVLCTLIGVVLCLLMMCLLVNWSLACVVVVTESKWGFQPLWRSAYLVKGMRSVSASLMVLFGVLVGFWVWMNASDVLWFDAVDGWRSWPFVLQLVVGTSVLTLFLLHNVSANTVLYMYCKALHGELAIEIAEEFAREYVSLPFDDEKVPHVVTVFPGE
ncbi:hypothetical protein HanXRQr2_Chr17g0796531 [Helianthus annuus]|uniref:Transmembrane protein n=1 Tax=Helianthus annuus TaxID=4232 RepID=A0A9K3GU47_HELAN|nr:uncharacterized protein LOC110924004 [Helianthus annuus]KAF5754903.1 hypothetical protein HanXRQr2_Chr17g0796531 [Helianthus annuus]KAJ0812643.1 hypothetical protein HanPSC8_Chr17g0764241 [Helianthus annuus]